MTVWIDGEPSPTGLFPVSDYTFVRGDGCFEALRAYDGKVFAISDHVERLERSAELMQLALPAAATLRRWIEVAGAKDGDCVVRVIVTRGDPVGDTPGRVVVITEPLPVVPAGFSFRTVRAPWHSAGRPWALAGAKTTSYAPNLAASREAKSMGADDALLLSDDRTILEGPTFSIAWVISGAIETPDLDLLILDSITRRHVLEIARQLGVTVRTGRFLADRLLEADEVFAMSTIKEVAAVVDIDGSVYAAGPVTARLKAAYRERVLQTFDRRGRA